MTHKPGPGWKHLGGAVYEHDSGARVHTYGLCRRDGRIVNGAAWPESQALNRFVRMNGGNRRRGVMAWAMNLEIGE